MMLPRENDAFPGNGGVYTKMLALKTQQHKATLLGPGKVAPKEIPLPKKRVPKTYDEIRAVVLEARGK